jgi:hypothetical protein
MRHLPPEEELLASMFYEALGTTRSLSCYILLKNREWDQLASLQVDPRCYTSAEAYAGDSLATAFLKKYKNLPTTFDRPGAARKSWREGEDACYKTNERLVAYLEGFSHPSCDARVAAFISKVQRKIQHTLGRAPRIDALRARHGPGATFSNRSRLSTVADKMQTGASFTRSACFFLPDWLGTAWGRASVSCGGMLIEVRGNRFATAPKDATKDRPIGAEPSLNIFYQLGVGAAIRQRLKHVGIDLDHGQETHRRLAREGSLSRSLATLDLKNASDTVCYNLVKLLLPPDWFALVNELRSPFTHFGGGIPGSPRASGSGWVKLEKFSSMGNGYTFELETLIFWALCSTAADELGSSQTCYVYGDDIIVDDALTEAVIPMLRFFGFETNTQKSFWGPVPFRESCGGDFFEGRAVRPCYLKETLNAPQKIIAAANLLRRALHVLPEKGDRIRRCWFAAQDLLPRGIRRCRGPEGLGDIVVHDTEEFWDLTSNGRIRVYRPIGYNHVPIGHFHPEVIHACGLYGLAVSTGFIPQRDGVSGYGIRTMLPYGVDWLPTNHYGTLGPYRPVTPRSPARPSALSYRVRSCDALKR